MKLLFEIVLFLLFPLSIFSQSSKGYYEFLSEGDDAFFVQDYKSAIKHYDMAEAEAELELYSLFLRGLSKAYLSEYESSILDFSEIISRNPILKNERWTYGTRIKKVGNTSITTPGGFSLNYDYIDVFYYRGMSKANLGDYRGAILDFDKYIELEKNDYSAYNYRAIAKFELKRFNESIVDFSQAIKLKNDIALIFYGRGAAYLNIGKLEEGCLDMSKAGELGYVDAYKIIKEKCK